MSNQMKLKITGLLLFVLFLSAYSLMDMNTSMSEVFLVVILGICLSYIYMLDSRLHELKSMVDYKAEENHSAK